jgi:hypothetical protein
MTPYVIQPGHGQAVYDLIAVSNHYGGMGGGHCKFMRIIFGLYSDPVRWGIGYVRKTSTVHLKSPFQVI